MKPVTQRLPFILAFIANALWVMTLVPMGLLMSMTALSSGNFWTSITGILIFICTGGVAYTTYQFMKLQKWAIIVLGLLAALYILTLTILSIGNSELSVITGIISVYLSLVVVANYYLYAALSAAENVKDDNIPPQ